MNRFDQILSSMKNDAPAASATSEASGRVRQKLFGPGTAGVERLRICADFQSLIPAYLNRSLSDARRLLLQDHMRECAVCRKMTEEAAAGPRPKVMPMAPSVSSSPRYVVAAALVACAGAAAWFTLTPSFDGPVATVESIQGGLYHVAGVGIIPVGDGRQLLDGESLQTAKASRAMVRLFDGSLVEMNERAHISMNRGWRGTTIHLNGGHIIVEAARQKTGGLYVSTSDSRVSVKGTIFSVNRGLKGTRVSVVEGEVQVDHNGRSESLKPGGQATTDPSLHATSAAADVAWSQNAARYLALLGEFNALQRHLEQIAVSGLRHQSRLFGQIPEDTAVYAAIPNAGNAVVEAKRVFDERIRTSSILRDWWKSGNPNVQAELDEMIGYIQQLSPQLGDEIVLTLTAREEFALFAEARGVGLTATLDSLLKKNIGSQPPFYYSVRKNILILAETQARLRVAEASVDRGATPSSPFRERIAQAYRNGVGWLLAANMEQILPVSVKPHNDRPSPVALGLNSMKYLVLERRELAGKVENLAAVNFSGPRQGVGSWLATPGRMSTLDFVTPEAGAAIAFVSRSPRTILEEIFVMVRKSEPGFDTDLADVERRLGLKILDDLAGPLGAEATFAIDGALIPSPSWKIALEVYSPQRLQLAIQTLVETFNRESGGSHGKFTLTQEQVSGRVYYKVTSDKTPLEIHYTYVDSFVVAGASRNVVSQAIQARQTGRTLTRSEAFRSQLPPGANPNFSAVLYHNLNGMLGPVVDQLKDSKVVTPEQRQAMLSLRDTQAGVIVAYGESDRITASSLGGFLGLNLGMLAGIEQLGGLLNVPGIVPQ